MIWFSDSRAGASPVKAQIIFQAAVTLQPISGQESTSRWLELFLFLLILAAFHTKFSNDSSAGLSEQHVLCFMNKRVFQGRCLIACICFRHLWKMNDVFTFFCVFERSIVLEGVTTPVTQSPPNEKHSCPLVSGYYSKYNKLLPCQFRKNLVFILYKSRP